MNWYSLCFSRHRSIPSKLSNVCSIIYRVVCNIISLLSFWCLQDLQCYHLFYSLLFFLCQSFYMMVNFIDHFEEPILCCIHFLLLFWFHFTDFCLHILFPSFYLFYSLFCSSFSGFLRTWLIWDFSSFLMYRFITINVVLIPALALSYKFWYVVFSFKFNIFLLFFLGTFYLIYDYSAMY